MNLNIVFASTSTPLPFPLPPLLWKVAHPFPYLVCDCDWLSVLVGNWEDTSTIGDDEETLMLMVVMMRVLLRPVGPGLLLWDMLDGMFRVGVGAGVGVRQALYDAVQFCRTLMLLPLLPLLSVLPLVLLPALVLLLALALALALLFLLVVVPHHLFLQCWMMAGLQFLVIHQHGTFSPITIVNK